MELDPDSFEKLLRLWGKTPRRNADPNIFHPAICHMMDVGHVAQALLKPPASPRWRKVLGKAFGVEPDRLVNWLPYFIAMHDIGKISAPFQENDALQRDRLRLEGFPITDHNWENNPYHAIISAVFVEQEDNLILIPPPLRQVCADALAGHHGRFAEKELKDDAVKRLRRFEPVEWGEFRRLAARLLSDRFVNDLPDLSLIPTNYSAAMMALSGFLVLCDWIGSDDRRFGQQSQLSGDAYLPHSSMIARESVKAVGFHQPVYNGAHFDFAELFPAITSPRPLQQAIDKIPDYVLSEPCLAIIEAPTGEGKTEAALSLSHRLANIMGSDEIYYAMPTTATSNQMHARIQTYLHQNLNLQSKVSLIHGQSYLVNETSTFQSLSNGSEYSSASDWLGVDKRKALLMPFGVGTVDQAELAALNVRFTMLRLSALAGKVVIFDEVHAYDTYMTAIIERLLNWLSSLGTSVIILSATLPLSRRKSLMQAYKSEHIDSTQAGDAYPCLAVINPDHCYIDNPRASQETRTIKMDMLRFAEEEASEKAKWLLQQIENGGCACWVANTVERAQNIYEAIITMSNEEVACLLIHSRFPFERRQELETQLVALYGPKGTRPAKGIVIGTQVLEQSLDLDFDLLVSDIAPVDLLLQRVGRMHRHAHHYRPFALRNPFLFINLPYTQTGKPTIFIDSAIYDEYILLRTIMELQHRDQLRLPQDYRPLVEAVYDDSPVAKDHPFYAAWVELQKKQYNAVKEANLRLIPKPDAHRSITAAIKRLNFEENETSASWIVAQTRLGEERITVIPMEKIGETARLPLSHRAINLDIPAPWPIQVEIMRQSISISQKQLIEALKSQSNSRPVLFTQSNLLKDAHPLWLVDGQAQLPVKNGVLILSLDQDTGLKIRKIGTG